MNQPQENESIAQKTDQTKDPSPQPQPLVIGDAAPSFFLEPGTPEQPQPFSRLLSKDMPCLPYRRRKGEIKTVLHWGQRKLLMSEIEFLTLFSAPGDLVVYAGSAPGSHIPYLAEVLFPELKFVLVDPADFHCTTTEQMDVRQCYFTSDTAREFKGRDNVLFISDIRTADPSKQAEMEVEEFVQHDNQAQKEWFEIIQPKKAMLKFRLPYPDRVAGHTTYLDGDVFLPVWGPQTTTECRLIPYGIGKERVYSHLEYEQQLFWFNTIYRESRWKMDIELENNGDCRYDPVAEIHILRQYLEHRQPRYRSDPQKLLQEIASISSEISKVLPGGHTLATRPLNKLLEDRSVANPFNQKVRTGGPTKRFRDMAHLPSSLRVGDAPVASQPETQRAKPNDSSESS